jgi:hypothetical protein
MNFKSKWKFKTSGVAKSTGSMAVWAKRKGPGVKWAQKKGAGQKWALRKGW